MRHGPNARAGWIVGVLVVGLMAGCATTEPSAPDDPSAPDTPQRIFRIQLSVTDNRAEAESTASQARTWWQNLDAAERPAALQEQGFQPDVVWQQPYYRVRVGQFDTRSAAQDVLATIRSRFPDALVAPVRVQPARQ